MPRIRSIKPEFFNDPDVADLSPFARLFFIGLWLYADREGRIEDNMRRLKAQIFPYDDVDCEPLAVELHVKDMIRRYPAVEKHGWIVIRNFLKHQRPHPKEPATLSPELDLRAGKFHGKVVSDHGKVVSNPVDLGKERKGVDLGKEGEVSVLQGPGETQILTHTPKNGNQSEPRDEQWAIFLAAYPGSRRTAGFMEQQTFVLVCDQIGFPALLAKLEQHKNCKDWKKGIIPNVKTYFEQKLWIQDPEPAVIHQRQVGHRPIVPSDEPL